MSTFLYAPLAEATFWMPPQASDYAERIDWLFYFILYLSIFFFAVIVACLVYFIIRYRRPLGEPATGKVTHNTPLELTWSGIPLLLVLVIFWVGMKDYIHLTVPPSNAFHVNVEAYQYGWNFTYPNGETDNVLYIPADRPTVLTMQSKDVIHSLFIPDFRIKKDVVPGRFSKVWFQPTREGRFTLFCTEYCGSGHSLMVTSAVALSPERLQQQLAALVPTDAVGRGQKIYKRYCAGCHSVDGSPMVGPTWKDLFYWPDRPLADGSRVLADENYLKESIFYPNAKMGAGFPNGGMQSYVGILNDDDIFNLLRYMMTISRHTPPEMLAVPTTQPDQPVEAPATAPAGI